MPRPEKSWTCYNLPVNIFSSPIAIVLRPAAAMGLPLASLVLCWIAMLCGVHARVLDAAETKTRVSIELISRPGLSLTASQQWYKLFTGLGVAGFKIRSNGTDDEVGITQRGSGATAEYRVVGILASDNQVQLPGGKFGLNDTPRLRKWLDNLGDQGAEGVTQPRSAFGLTAKQLEQVTDDLKRRVTTSTKDLKASEAVQRIGEGLMIPLLIDPAARGDLARTKVQDDLMGLSSGTALAAILRPAGLALVPERPMGGELRYRVGPQVGTGEVWPVGWKPPAKTNEVLPALFEFLNVEITDTPVAEAVEAIAGRLKVPVVYDRRALALHGVNPAEITAKVPAKRSSYIQTLNKVLAAARLKFELRLDEAEQPLLWITTVKPTP